MSSIKHTFECWHDGLISTSQILARILTSDLPVSERLEHIATVTLRLAEQEEADAALLYVEPEDAEERAYDEAGGDYVWGDHEDDCCPHCDKAECECKDEL